MSDVTVNFGGQPIEISLPENAAEAARQAGLAQGYASSAATALAAIAPASATALADLAAAKTAALADVAAAGTTTAPVVLTSTTTLAASHLFKSLLLNMEGPGSSAINQVRIPSNSVTPLPVGAYFKFIRTGGAMVQIVPDAAGQAVITGPTNRTVAGDFAETYLLQTSQNNWLHWGTMVAAPSTAIKAKVFLDVAAVSTLRQERTGAAATTAVLENDPVGSMRNMGIGGGWATADADNKRPILRRTGTRWWLDTTGGKYLRLAGQAINLSTFDAYAGINILGGTNGGLITLAPATGPDYNTLTGMALLYVNGNKSTVAWRGGPASSMSAGGGGFMPGPHVFEVQKRPASVALTIDGLPVITDPITDVFTVQGGDVIIGARQGNGIAEPGQMEFYGLVITEEAVTDRTAIRSFMESRTGSGVPKFPPVTTLAEAEAFRTTIINQVFGGTLPTAVATGTVEAPHKLTGYVTLTNLDYCEKMDIPGYTSKPRKWVPVNPRNDIWFICCQGHGAAPQNNNVGQVVVRTLLNMNIRCVTIALPGGINDWTSGSPLQHDTTPLPLSDYLGPIIAMVNTIRAQHATAKIFITGISGGGSTATWASAMDTRILESFPFAGTLPDYLMMQTGVRDNEQLAYAVSLGADVDLYLMLYLLGSIGPGRRQTQILGSGDVVILPKTTVETRPDWSAGMTALATAIGSAGNGYERYWDMGNNDHTITQAAFDAKVVTRIPAP